MSKKKTKKKVVNAPYVEPNSIMLGDTYLDPVESVHRERERALNQASASRIHGQDELEDPERSAGPRMPYTEVLNRIRQINPSIKVLEGTPGSVAIYRPKRHWEYDESERDGSKSDFFWHHVYVTGMEKQGMPEYSHVLLDTSRLATREIRGWRSVLMALIKSGALTIEENGDVVAIQRPGCIGYAAVVEKFGDPSGDSRSNRWFEQLVAYRDT